MLASSKPIEQNGGHSYLISCLHTDEECQLSDGPLFHMTDLNLISSSVQFPVHSSKKEVCLLNHYCFEPTRYSAV